MNTREVPVRQRINEVLKCSFVLKEGMSLYIHSRSNFKVDIIRIKDIKQTTFYLRTNIQEEQNKFGNVIFSTLLTIGEFKIEFQV